MKLLSIVKYPRRKIFLNLMTSFYI